MVKTTPPVKINQNTRDESCGFSGAKKTSSAHTPAPWKIKEDRDGTWIVLDLLPNLETTIAKLGYSNAAMNRANANLISAAPELLEELETIVDCWKNVRGKENGTDPLTPWEQERLEFCEKAIAKARS